MPTKRKLSPKTDKQPAKPAGVAGAAQAATGRSNVTAKPDAKPTTKPADKPGEATSTVAKPAGHIARTIRTIAANVTNFGGLSDRDEAYFSFYKRLAAKHGGKLSVAQIFESGERPNYSGSNKPHDAGAINRLRKAGLFAVTADGVLSLTANGTSHKAA